MAEAIGALPGAGSARADDPSPAKTELLSKAQAAEALGVAVHSIERYVASGVLASVAVGPGRVAFLRADVEALRSRPRPPKRPAPNALRPPADPAPVEPVLVTPEDVAFVRALLAKRRQRAAAAKAWDARSAR